MNTDLKKVVKEPFIQWMISTDGKDRFYFSKQFYSKKNKISDELNEYEEVYRKAFNSELFIIDPNKLDNEIAVIQSNLYGESPIFSEYNKAKANGRPSAILGKMNYLKFLREYFSTRSESHIILEGLIQKYCDACLSTSWLDDELYKFEWAHWLHNRANFNSQSDEQLLQLFIDSQKQRYSGSKCVQFIKQGARKELSKYIGIEDVKYYRQFAEGKAIDEIGFADRNTSFPILSCWLSVLFPEQIYPVSKASFAEIARNIFSIKLNSSGLDFITDLQRYFNIVESSLKNRPTYLAQLKNKINTENLQQIDFNWAVQDFFLFVDRNTDLSKQKKDMKYWLYAPGENADKWEEFYNKGIMGLGWDYLGNLKNYIDKNDIEKKLQELENVQSSKKNDAAATFDFRDMINIGDVVIVKKGRGELLGYGVVTSDYFYDDARSTYNNCRTVDWQKKGNWKTNHSLALKTLTNITNYKTEDSDHSLYSESLLALMNGKALDSNISNYGSPLNQILFGPPGTGKTYNSINRALEIIGGKKAVLDWNDRKDVKNRFDQFTRDNQIVFTTFHQSMSYEDFIEGIKPLKPEEGKETVTYDVEAGLFQQACAKAGLLCYDYFKNQKEVNSNYSFDDLHEAFVEHIEDSLDKGEKPTFKTLTGKDVSIIKVNNNNSISARAKDSVATRSPAPLTKENLQKLYDRFSSIEEIRNLRQVRDTVQVTPRITEFYAVFRGLKDFESSQFRAESKNVREFEASAILSPDEIVKKFLSGVYKEAIDSVGDVAPRVVLIIDEINRGNISQIFGELITLIEENKRAGKDEALEITLPYSKDKFTVPANLYIVGTMNTADRSVEALDTALRRRFSFKEMLPDANLLKDIQFKGFSLDEVLQTINDRIEVLLDRDHMIGHSYFIGIKSGDVETFEKTFKDCIIPLLQEYFYGDYEKIALILGAGFIKSKDTSAIKFAAFDDIDFPESRGRYELISGTVDIEAAVMTLLNRNVVT
jgi:hypothetical protein